MAAPEVKIASETHSRVKAFAGLLYDVQDVRKAQANRVRAMKENDMLTEGEVEHITGLVVDTLVDVEKKISRRYVMKAVESHPVWDIFLSDVHGIGPRLAGSILADLEPFGGDEDHPEGYCTAAKVWARAGLHVIRKCLSGCDIPQGYYGSECPKCGAEVVGRAEQRRAGKRSTWSPFLKTTCFKVGNSFIKLGSKYRLDYERYKTRALAEMKCFSYCNNEGCKVKKKGTKLPRHTKRCPECEHPTTPNKAHLHAMSRRYMVKLFLSHLHHVWWVEVLGNDVVAPYSHEHMGHSKMINWRERLGRIE